VITETSDKKQGITNAKAKPKIKQVLEVLEKEKLI